MRRPGGLILALAVVVAGCSGGGADTSDLGPELVAGAETFNSSCATCHGGTGEGGSAPGLQDVLETFGSCDDQVRWITLGSDGWQEEVGATYGDTGKEITAVMPSFAETLNGEQIAQVAAFERHRFGDAPEADVMSDCGLSPG